MQNQETQVVSTYSAGDALEAIHTFLGNQIAEARQHFEAQVFGTVEFVEEQAFIKTLMTARAIYNNIAINGSNNGANLLMLLSRVTMEYRNAAKAIADSMAMPLIAETFERCDQATCAAWGMVYHFVNREYRRTNAA